MYNFKNINHKSYAKISLITNIALLFFLANIIFILLIAFRK